MEMSGQLHAPAALSPQKYLPAPIWQKVGWTPGPAGRCEEEKILLPLTRMERRFDGRPLHSLVVIQTELSRLVLVTVGN
jgi:hypothetical protein